MVQCTAALPHDDSIDAYVVIYKHAAVALNGDVIGLGLYHHGSPFGNDTNFVHAVYTVAVVDAKNGDLIAGGKVASPDTSFFSGSFPMKEIPASDWPESAGTMTDTQKSDVKAIIADLIAANLSAGMIKAHLPSIDSVSPLQ